MAERGFQPVMGYLRRLKSGFQDCKRTKLMLVGLGGAGKTRYDVVSHHPISLMKTLNQNKSQSVLFSI